MNEWWIGPETSAQAEEMARGRVIRGIGMAVPVGLERYSSTVYMMTVIYIDGFRTGTALGIFEGRLYIVKRMVGV